MQTKNLKECWRICLENIQQCVSNTINMLASVFSFLLSDMLGQIVRPCIGDLLLIICEKILKEKKYFNVIVLHRLYLDKVVSFLIQQIDKALYSIL